MTEKVLGTKISSGNSAFRGLLWWTLLITSDTAAQLLLKTGAVRIAPGGPLVNYFIVCGYSLYIVSFIAWMQILKETRLFIALSSASVLYITIAFASHYFLGERLTPQLFMGTLLISAGVLILGWKKDARQII